MIFLNSASSAAAPVFYLPALCTQTDTEGKQSSEYFDKFGKNTIFNEHPVSGSWQMTDILSGFQFDFFFFRGSGFHLSTESHYLVNQNKFCSPSLNIDSLSFYLILCF